MAKPSSSSALHSLLVPIIVLVGVLLYHPGLPGLGAQPDPSPTARPASPVPTPSPIPVYVWADENTPADALIVRYWGADRQPGPYSPPNVIPPLQIWADGRLIWLASGTPYAARDMREGWLSPAVMQALLQRIIAAGFSQWEPRYAEAAPLPVTYLVIDLPGDTPKQVAVSGQGPPGFFALVEALLALPDQAQDVRPYVPEQALLWLHGPLPAEDDRSPDPDQLALDVNAGAALEGIVLEGEPLRALWDRVNDAPANPVAVTVTGRTYFVTLAVPGVSLCTGPVDPAFEVRWICPALPAAG